MKAVAVPGFILAFVMIRPWRWTRGDEEALARWQPSARFVCILALAVGLTLYWCVLTAFQSGGINAIDFTVFYDRPLFHTIHGRPLLTDADHGFGSRAGLTIHAYWVMFPLSALYAIYATPQWLLALSVVSVVFGSVHILRIARRLGMGGVLAVATMLAFLLNDNTARTLNYGFHPEVLYACFIPWVLHAGLTGNRRSFLVATIACVSVKEDAFMPLLAASIALMLVRGREMTWADRVLFLVVPCGIGLADLWLYYGVVLPRLHADQSVYSGFWVGYGATPTLALAGMVSHPIRVLHDVMTSGFFSVVMVPHLFMPLIGWRWIIGAIPIISLYGASSNEQLHWFGIYYAIVLVPFLVIAASAGASTIARYVTRDGGRAPWIAALIVLAGALPVGGGYVLRPWRPEISAVPSALRRLTGERVVLVQSGLYPHAGYEASIKLLTPEALHDARAAGAAVLIAPSISAYPLNADELARLLQRPSIAPMPGGLLAVRVDGPP